MLSQPQMLVKSSNVFNSKQNKSSRNLKKLLISSPLLCSPVNSPTPSLFPFSSHSDNPVVVLRAKYNFRAQNITEVSIRANDYFKLLDRLGNGWLLVQCIDRNETGLVPALYVEIAVNDAKRPISIEWLTKVKSPKSAIFDEIKSISVSTVLIDIANQTWYRLDIRMRSGAFKYIAKYYHDFYDLHGCLAKELHKSVKLPSQLESLDTSFKPISNKSHMKELVAQCKDLDTYLNVLLTIDNVRESESFVDFINAPTSKQLEVPYHLTLSSAAINDNLHPQSLNVTKAVNPLHTLSFSPTAPLPPMVEAPSTVSKHASSMKPFSYSNTKYLSYLNQSASQPSSPTIPLESTTGFPLSKSPQKSTISESRSCQTLSSFSSLFASYDTTSEDIMMSPHRTGRGESESLIKKDLLRSVT